MKYLSHELHETMGTLSVYTSNKHSIYTRRISPFNIVIAKNTQDTGVTIFSLLAITLQGTNLENHDC